MLPQYSTSPNILRHWIPLEFSKDITDYQTTDKDIEAVRSIRTLVTSSSDMRMFRNHKLQQKLQQSKLDEPQFKLVFKNKSSKLFEPRQKIKSNHLIKEIVESNFQDDILQSKESAAYKKLYETPFDKQYIYKYVGAEKPKSSFSVSKRRPTIVSCDTRQQNFIDAPSEKRTSCTTAIHSRRNSKSTRNKETLNGGERRITWLWENGRKHLIRDRSNSNNRNINELMISGKRPLKDDIIEHWKLKQEEILDLMKRIRII